MVAQGSGKWMTEDGLVIWMLGIALIVSIIFIGAIAVFGSEVAQSHTAFFEVLASSMAGALAGRITSRKRSEVDESADDMAVIGREATRRVVAEALRGLSSDHDERVTKKKPGQGSEPERY